MKRTQSVSSLHDESLEFIPSVSGDVTLKQTATFLQTRGASQVQWFHEYDEITKPFPIDV